jgi:hypothetical protein
MGIKGAQEHSVKVEEQERDANKLWRYLCDHTSKSKQAQLGYVGKQWGFINKKNLVKTEPVEKITLTRCQNLKLSRWIKRLTRCRHLRGRKGTSTFFGSPGTIKRMVEYIKKSGVSDYVFGDSNGSSGIVDKKNLPVDR